MNFRQAFLLLRVALLVESGAPAEYPSDNSNSKRSDVERRLTGAGDAALGSPNRGIYR